MILRNPGGGVQKPYRSLRGYGQNLSGESHTYSPISRKARREPNALRALPINLVFQKETSQGTEERAHEERRTNIVTKHIV